MLHTCRKRSKRSVFSKNFLFQKRRTTLLKIVLKTCSMLHTSAACCTLLQHAAHLSQKVEKVGFFKKFSFSKKADHPFKNRFKNVQHAAHFCSMLHTSAACCTLVAKGRKGRFFQKIFFFKKGGPPF